MNSLKTVSLLTLGTLLVSTGLCAKRPKIVASLRKRLLEIKKEIRPADPVEEIPKGVLIYGETEAKTFKG